MARPLKEISAREVELLAGCGATSAEIAAKLGCSKDTLERRFAASLDRGREVGRISLRGKQFELAMKGNVQLLIWLGKQMLGQRDRYEFSAESTEDLLSEANQYFAPDTEANRRLGRTQEARRLSAGNGDSEPVPEVSE